MARFGMDDGSEVGVLSGFEMIFWRRTHHSLPAGGGSVSSERVLGCCVASHISYPGLQRRRLGSVAHFLTNLFSSWWTRQFVGSSLSYRTLVGLPCLLSCFCLPCSSARCCSDPVRRGRPIAEQRIRMRRRALCLFCGLTA